MVLEAVMLCIDNSEWSRNGDYHPTRFDSQRETINFLTSAKINGNPETTVGLLSLAGDRIEVHISPTREVGQIMTALAKNIKISGESKFASGLKTAALALKNRQNKNQRQRIIVLCGSPVREDNKELVKLAKSFKKNNIAVDVINFGSESAANENAAKWEAFIEAVNASDNSHLVNVPPGPHNLSDMVMASPIIVEPGQAPRPVGGAASDDIDPNMDPEMAMAIRMSMEEERARQARLAGEAGGAVGTAVSAVAAGGSADVPMEDDEEALMQQAIAMSMQLEQEQQATEPQSSTTSSTEAAPSSSASAAAAADATPAAAALGGDAEFDAAMQDPDFINSLLASVTQPQGDQSQQGSGEAPKDAKEDDKK